MSAVAPATPAYALRATLFTLPCTAFNCETFTPSVGFTPAATLVSLRSLPAEPTDTVLASPAIEPAPSATEFGALAVAFVPIAVAFVPDPIALAPMTVAPSDAAFAPLPTAIAPTPAAVAAGPKAIELLPVAPSLP
ncbi:hypothetical protein BLA24064_00625 [Burkholderia latens]|uniref:DNA-directed RNA polymerase II n=1 Tax=Burkholderia latens TaxID=488446 RepID=A0A6P2HH36_9BURK|nr:hypothetical protein BLA24064_00625 [Burkholderia latens]